MVFRFEAISESEQLLPTMYKVSDITSSMFIFIIQWVLEGTLLRNGASEHLYVKLLFADVVPSYSFLFSSNTEAITKTNRKIWHQGVKNNFFAI